MAGVLPFRDKGSPGRTGQEDKARGKRRSIELDRNEQVESIELSLRIGDVCNNLEHSGAKGRESKLVDVQGLPSPSSRATHSNKQ